MGRPSRRTVLALLVISSLAVLASVVSAVTQRSLEAWDELPDWAGSGPGIGPMTSPGLLERQGLAVPAGGGGGFDDLQAGYPSVVRDGGVYKMWYFGCNAFFVCRIGYATSADGRTWTKSGPVLSPSLPEEGALVAYPTVVKVGSAYWMWYNGFDGSAYRILAATSADGISWTKHGVVLDVGPGGSPDAFAAAYARAISEGGAYILYYTGISSPTSPTAVIMRATSSDGLNWTKQGVVLSPGPPGSMDSNAVSASSVALVGSTYEMIYTGADGSIGRLMYAESTGGIAWNRSGVALNPEPPAESGIHYANFLVDSYGRWFVWYTARAGGSDLQIYFAIFGDFAPPLTTARVEGIPGNNGWYASTVSVFLSAEDDKSGVTSINYSIDGGAWTTYSEPIVLGDGVHTLSYYAVDGSGNQETSRTLQILVDTTAPVTTARVEGIPGTNGWYASTVSVFLSAEDGLSGVASINYSLDNGPWTSYSGSFVLFDGVHTLSYFAVDTSGNQESVRTLQARVDAAPPIVDITSPSGNLTSSDVLVSWTATDLTSGIKEFEISVDAGAFQSVGTNTTKRLVLSDGRHTVRVRATDAAGNLAVAEVRFSIDTNPFRLGSPFWGFATPAALAITAGVVAFVVWRQMRRPRPPAG